DQHRLAAEIRQRDRRPGRIVEAERGKRLGRIGRQHCRDLAGGRTGEGPGRIRLGGTGLRGRIVRDGCRRHRVRRGIAFQPAPHVYGKASGDHASHGRQNYDSRNRKSSSSHLSLLRPVNMMKDTKTSNQMWGGRFASGPSAVMEAINASIGFDRKLAAQDIEGSLAHAAMLAATGVISKADHRQIEKGLKAVAKEIEKGDFTFSTKL